MAVEAATLGNSRGRVLDNCAGNKAPSLHITAVLRGENNQDRYDVATGYYIWSKTRLSYIKGLTSQFTSQTGWIVLLITYYI